MSKKASLLWLDLEMTGLDPQKDAILEVAAIATDHQLNEIASYEGIIHVDEEKLLKLLKQNAAFWDANVAARDGLISQNKEGGGLEEVQAELVSFVDRNFDTNKPIYLAGNSVHMDQKFIEKNWPILNALLHYRILDVSAWKIVFENSLKKRFVKPEEHRALGDIKGSIEELKYYLKYMKSGKTK